MWTKVFRGLLTSSSHITLNPQLVSYFTSPHPHPTVASPRRLPPSPLPTVATPPSPLHRRQSPVATTPLATIRFELLLQSVCVAGVTTELYRGEDPEHMEIIEGIERGDALPGLRRYSDIAAVAEKVGFEVVKEKDLAKPPSQPWWSRLKMGRIVYWRNHIVVTVLEAIGVAPKGTVDVHEMLFKIADYLTRGGETGIFTPMHMILCRKPERP